MKAQREGINALAEPSGTGCVECWRPAAGGSIFADAPNVVISDAVIVHQISMHQNIMRLQVTRSLRASSRGSGGFTITGQVNFSPGRLSPLLARIR
jgi:hypothetical protein